MISNEIAISMLIALGAGIMFLSLLRTRQVLWLLKGSQYTHGWRILLFLMIFFLVGYIATLVLVLAGITEILVILTGVIFLFGALFVYLMVRMGYLTIDDLLRTTVSKDYWETTFNAMQDAVALVDRDHRIVQANQAFVDIAPGPSPQIVGQTYYTALNGASCPETDCPLEQAMQSGRPARCVHEYGKRIFDVQTVPVWEGNVAEPGHVARMVYVMRDITERKRAEEALREAHNELERRVEERTAELAKANKELQAEITERKQAEEALRKRTEEISLLYEVGRQFSSTLNLERIYDTLYDLVSSIMDCDGLFVSSYDSKDNLIRCTYARHERQRLDVSQFPPIPLEPEGQGTQSVVIRTGEPLLIQDCQAQLKACQPVYYTDEDRFAHKDEIPDDADRTRSAIVVPLKLEGQVVGLVQVSSGGYDAYNEDDLRFLAALALQVAVASNNALLYQQAQREIAERQRAEEALRESEERYRAVAETAIDAIITMDSRGSIVFWNPAAETIFGYSVDEAIGQPLAFVMPERFRKVYRNGMKPAFSAGESDLIGKTIESSGLRKDGSEFPVELSLASGKTREGVFFTGIVRDVTERKQLEAQLRQAQKMEAIGQLASGIAHDFNNLLTPIGGFAELLLRKAPEDSRQHEYLRQIKIGADRAAALTGQLRLFTRQEEGEHRPTQLNSVVEETRDLLEHSIPKEITIELRLASELWAVEADPSQLSQVLMNLCVNARDAMPDGGTLTLETRNVTLDEEGARAIPETQAGRYVRLSVSDTGCGMSPEVQARLFEPFFTTKEVGKGTGLGLSVVYGIVKGHNGFINVHSEEGRGSTFHVYLPAIELAMEGREVEMLELPTGTETILLVDDEERVLALGQRVLEGCGYTVLMAEDGVQALEVYQVHQGEIGLVVLDVVMPQMGGRECLRCLREMDPQVRVLMSTGYTVNGSAQQLVAEGALGVVEKPFQLYDFATAVRAALDKS